MNSCRQTWAEVDLKAVKANAAFFRQSVLASSCRLMAVVKADGYGHGAVEVALAVLESGADCLGVAFADEAVALRQAGIGHPILVLGYTPPQAVEVAVRHRIALTVFSEQVLEAVIEIAERLRCRTPIHIKIDTGLGRLGVTGREEAASLIRKAQQSLYVEVEGIFTHFAEADSEDPAYTEHQYNRFISICGHLEDEGLRIPLKHCCNTAAALRHPHYHLDMVRIGIGLYGLQPAQGASDGSSPLQPAMQLKTRIASLKRIGIGEWVSYGRTFRAERSTLAAILPIGYADGVPRLISNRGQVLVCGIRVPVIGRVCMDQMAVDVTELPSVSVGDEAIVFGGEQGIGADETAAWAQTIHYELVCGIGKRVPREYIR
ncbi:alanine racemase [Paenibacillus sp. GD4]|jgi:alanine racemase|uniref:alanine racemase n=1 Tax=Paenibacillus sp. GD4 TaxID=3068890 RepID=UPI0027965EC1|nr:alanine racemase [Paenibacillus sp. GD4]MDQ1914343.1 alanine racemase [Paenibacillus sp. GD4]